MGEPLSSSSRQLLEEALEKHRSAALENGLSLPNAEEALGVIEEGSSFRDGAPRSKLDLPLTGFFAFLERSDVQSLHLVRLLFLLEGMARMGRDWLLITRAGYGVLDRYRKSHPHFDLNQLQDALASVRVSGAALLKELLGGSPLRRWPKGTLLPLLQRHESTLCQALEKTSSLPYQVDHRTLLTLLQAFDELPRPLFAAVVDRALDGKRPSADYQDLLGRRAIPNLVEALGSRQAGRRAEAASWLGRLRETGAAEALEAALRKEKNARARVEMQRALEALGRPAVSIGAPAATTALPFALPESEAEVAPLVAAALKLKKPRPWPELAAVCGALTPASRQRLGETVLAAWLEEPEKRLGLSAVVAACLDGQVVPRLQTLLDEWSKRPRLVRVLLGLAAELQAPESAYLLLDTFYNGSTPTLRQDAAAELQRLGGDDWVDRMAPGPGVLSAEAVRALWTERLRVAMLTGREWEPGFWRHHLLEHPLLGALCRRLVWQQGDRALSSEEVDGASPVRLAHALTVAGEDHPRPVLVQFPPGIRALTPEERRQRRLRDFQGRKVEDRALYAALSALGYERYQPDDRRYYHVLRKPITGTTLYAVLFLPRGAGSPERGQEVLLGEFCIATAGRWDQIPARTLGSLPAPLVGESRLEVERALAALIGVPPG